MADISKIKIGTTEYNLKDAVSYRIPNGGIPASDLDQSVQNSLTLADSALLSHLDISGKANTVDLATVATSGSYNDLLNKPTIPSLLGYATETYVNNKFKDVLGVNADGVSALKALTEDSDTATGLLNEIGNKVDKVSGKGLSTEDYTTTEKNKLSGIETGAQAHKAPTTAEVKSALGTGSGTTKYLREDGSWATPPNDNTWRPLGTTADTACAGNDSRLSNSRPASDVYSWAKASSKPSYSWSEIGSRPTALSSFSNDAGYITGITKSMVTTALGYTPPTTNTTYSAGTALSLSGTTFNHSNYATAGTAGTSRATSGSTIAVPYVTVNAQGHVTGYGTHTHTISGFLTSHQDISGKQNKIPKSTAATTGTVNLACDTMYNIGTLTGNITFNLTAAPSDGYMHEWMFSFDVGSTAYTVTMPSGVTFPSSVSIAANKHYEVNIKDTYGLIASW